MAQLIAESGLDPNAVSHVGARGIAQFMPGTWADVSKALRLQHGPHDEGEAIVAGAFYMAQLYDQWTARRPVVDRKRLAEASYNAGLGTVLNAQKRANRDGLAGILYSDIERYLPKETRDYVRRIECIRQRL